MSPPESKQPPGKAAAAKTKGVGQNPFYAEGVTSLVGCGREGATVVACDEVVARLQAADRDERQLGVDVGELRRRAQQIADVHLQELDVREAT